VLFRPGGVLLAGHAIKLDVIKKQEDFAAIRDRQIDPRLKLDFALEAGVYMHIHLPKGKPSTRRRLLDSDVRGAGVCCEQQDSEKPHTFHIDSPDVLQYTSSNENIP
jgi:hypothetical protein